MLVSHRLTEGHDECSPPPPGVTLDEAVPEVHLPAR